MIIKYLLAAVAVYGQSAWLVKDVPGTVAASSEPRGAVRMGNAIYFMTDSTPRVGLWKFDLATRRSTMLREFPRPSRPDSTHPLTVINNRLVFRALGSFGRGLWASDGTAQGTTEIAPELDWSANDTDLAPVAMGGYLYALGFAGSEFGLWRTNGTAAGTGPVVPGVQMSIQGLAEVGGQIYFSSFQYNDGTYRLWRTDGTAAGTAEVAGPAQGLSYVGEMRKLGSKLLFRATTTAAGSELWVSDGTTAGTTLLTDIELGPGSSSPALLQAHAGFMYFSAITTAEGRELWKTNGTAAGTSLVRDIVPGPSYSLVSVASGVANGYLFFFSGIELMRTDGTAGGTVSLGYASAPTISVREDGSGVYFPGGRQLWKSDGSIANTVQVKEFCPTCNANIGLMRATAGGRSFFRAYTPENGYEFWETDGTAAGTIMAADLNTTDAGSSPSSMVAYGGFHYYTTTDAQQMVHLWRTNGNSAGTTLVTSLYQGQQPSEIHIVNGRMVFVGRSFQGPQGLLWASDGTAAGTAIIQSHAAHNGGGIVSGGKLFYAGYSYNTGRFQIWTTDGTVAGTSEYGGAQPQIPLGGSYAATLSGGRIVFQGCDPVSLVCGPCVSDGTTAGTVLLNTTAGHRGQPFAFVSVGSQVLFGMNNLLWRTDGTIAGTSQVSPNGPIQGPWFAIGGEAFFGLGASLYKSDGTAGGTVEVLSDLNPAVYGDIHNRFDFATLSGKVLFQANPSGFGFELWSTNGSTAGTTLVKAVGPDFAGGFLSSFRTSGSYVYFSACAGGNFLDCEPWVTDGTTAGTKRVADIAPGAAVSSNPVMLAAAPGGRMYMAAADPARGSELWLADPVSCAVPLDVTSQLTITAGVPVFNRNSGRFVQNVTIRNNGAAVDGLAYVFGGLNSSVTVSSSHGVTHCASPVGSPYRDIGPIGAGQTVSLALELIAPAGTPLGYAPKVVSAVDGPR